MKAIACPKRRGLGAAALAVAIVLPLAGCSTSEVLVAHAVPLEPVAKTVPEDQLLDVAVSVFDPGVPDGEISKDVQEELIRSGTFINIRRAESRYLAVELRDTLHRSGFWGRTWVTPAVTTAADLNVVAEITESDGDDFALVVTATDATGDVWIDHKRYSMETAAGAFNRQRYPELDPYQDVLNEIANDLANHEHSLSADAAHKLRQVAALRFAAELSPEAFDGYVEQRHGQYDLRRLPAAGDPMFARTQSVRQRDFLFLDTLNQHYTSFHDDAQSSYDHWRQYAREEAISVKELTRSARWRTGIGIATIVSSFVYGANSNNSFSDRVVRDALMYVGMDVLQSASLHRQEKRIHAQTLEELSTSFDDDVKPMVVNIEGTQHRLVGTADLQYQEWQSLLRQIYSQETGFALPEMQMYVEPDPVAPAGDTTAAGDEAVGPPSPAGGDDTAGNAASGGGDATQTTAAGEPSSPAAPPSSPTAGSSSTTPAASSSTTAESSSATGTATPPAAEDGAGPS